MNIVSYLKPLAHAEKEHLLKLKKQLVIAYDENEQWIESFFQRGASVSYARFQLSMKFFDEKDTDALIVFLKHIQSYKVKYLIAVLPEALEITKASSEMINESITQALKVILKYKIKIVIEPSSQSYKQLAYILKAFKPTQVQFVFNPVHIYETQGSILSLYRIFKSHIQLVVADDVTKDNLPALIGYGEAQLIALFKLMVKDVYQGDILLDPKFDDYLTRLSKRSKSFWKIFSKKQIKSYDEIKKQMRVDEKKDIHILDIYMNQYDVLFLVFRLG